MRGRWSCGNEPRPFTITGWTVPDIAAAVRDLVNKGITFTRYGVRLKAEGRRFDPPLTTFLLASSALSTA